MMKAPVIHVEDLTIAYLEKPVLIDIDLSINENTVTAIVGPNGAGKSTLMKGILGLLKPVAGVVEIFGESYRDVYQRVAYIPQKEQINWNFPTTVLDVVTMGRYAHLGLFRRPKKEDRDVAIKALRVMGMEEFQDRSIVHLSGGQKQRVFIARAIAQDADLYIMDEPLQGVDIKTEKKIAETFQTFQQLGKTIVCVHHSIDTISEYFDHVVLLNRRIVASGPVETTLTKEHLRATYGGKI